MSKKGRQAAQLALDFDITGERREQNSLINDIRREVERWREQLERRHPYTRKLLGIFFGHEYDWPERRIELSGQSGDSAMMALADTPDRVRALTGKTASDDSGHD